MDGHHDIFTVTGQCFVDRVINHFEHHVVQTGAVIGVTDIHAGTLTDCVQPFQNLDT